MNKMNSFLADELAKKVKYLSLALNNATDIISNLEAENKRLAELLLVIDNSKQSFQDLNSQEKYQNPAHCA